MIPVLGNSITSVYDAPRITVKAGEIPCFFASQYINIGLYLLDFDS